MSEPTPAPEQLPAPPQLYCGNCGAPIPPNKHFCEQCLAPASLATPYPPAPQPEPAGVAPTPAAPAAPTVVPATPPTPAGVPPAVPAAPPFPEMPTVAPLAPPVPAGVPPVVPVGPAGPRPAGPLPVGTAVPYPPPAAQATNWPWIVLLVLSICLACPLLIMAAFLLIGSSGTQDSLVSLLCFIPALILIGTAILGGVLAFRKPRGQA